MVVPGPPGRGQARAERRPPEAACKVKSCEALLYCTTDLVADKRDEQNKALQFVQPFLVAPLLGDTYKDSAALAGLPVELYSL